MAVEVPITQSGGVNRQELFFFATDLYNRLIVLVGVGYRMRIFAPGARSWERWTSWCSRIRRRIGWGDA